HRARELAGQSLQSCDFVVQLWLQSSSQKENDIPGGERRLDLAARPPSPTDQVLILRKDAGHLMRTALSSYGSAEPLRENYRKACLRKLLKDNAAAEACGVLPLWV